MYYYEQATANKYCANWWSEQGRIEGVIDKNLRNKQLQ
jgi:hypothetical protein